MTAVAERAKAPARPSISTAQPKRRWSLLVGGLLLVLLSAGVFAVIQLGGDARVQVLAVARPVAAGQPISAADLREAVEAARHCVVVHVLTEVRFKPCVERPVPVGPFGQHRDDRWVQAVAEQVGNPD